jgi:hypothetical protein
MKVSPTGGKILIDTSYSASPGSVILGIMY